MRTELSCTQPRVVRGGVGVSEGCECVHQCMLAPSDDVGVGTNSFLADYFVFRARLFYFLCFSLRTLCFLQLSNVL